MNLSDLAAAGSEPKAFFLSISLPRIDENWLEGFSKGLMEEARRFNCPLRGGDTVKSFVGRDGALYRHLYNCDGRTAGRQRTDAEPVPEWVTTFGSPARPEMLSPL